MPKKYWPGAGKYDLYQLGRRGKIISITNKNFPVPAKFQQFDPLVFDSGWGKFKIKKALEILKLNKLDIADKNLYFTGGNIICCLANTIKSLYPLPQMLGKNLEFILLKDFVWAVDEYSNILTLDEFLLPPAWRVDKNKDYVPGLSDKRKEALRFSYVYWRTHHRPGTPGNPAKQHKVALFFHYNGQVYPLYESGQSKWRIQIILELSLQRTEPA